jgi:hypothetical protein
METRSGDQHENHSSSGCSVARSVAGATDDTGCGSSVSRSQTIARYEAISAGQSHPGNQPDTMIVKVALRGRAYKAP